MSSLPDNARLNQLASDWMHRGMALMEENSLEQAVRCFDEAIGLRRGLPLEENPFYRYGLSAGWINRGDALARWGEGGSVTEAVKSYDEALALLETLPLCENALYPRRLAIAWINRGIALQRREIPGGGWEAVECFREALAVLEAPPVSTDDGFRTLRAGAWGNLAGALMELGEEQPGIRSAAHQALALVKPSEGSDRVALEVGLKARHLLCRLAVRDIAEEKPLSRATLAEATDAVEEALALVRSWKLPEDAALARLARGIFRFGCRIYESAQPHFLAEFLMEYLSPEEFGAALLDDETAGAVQAAIWGVLDQLQMEGFRFVSTPEFEPFLSDIRELRKVEERLRCLRAG